MKLTQQSLYNAARRALYAGKITPEQQLAVNACIFKPGLTLEEGASRLKNFLHPKKA